MNERIKLSDVVYDTLKWNIETEKLPPGLILEVSAIARIFKLSRTPIVIALKALTDQKLVQERSRRGFVVGEAKPFRKDLVAAGLTLTPTVMKSVAKRSWRSQFYPRVEREIAMCLPFGCFSISATSLARQYNVSRTIAHETLVRLERLGLVRQERARWFAGPLTAADLSDHYEMRWLLEPRALQEAAPSLDAEAIRAMHARAGRCLDRVSELRPKEFERLERDLHDTIVLRCRNRQMAETIRRSQLPLMAINHSFRSYRGSKILRQAIVEHMRVLDALAAGDISNAAQALEAHLRASLPVIRNALAEGPADWTPPPYMVREDGRSRRL